jgi:nicotinamide N-methyltransferase
MMSGVVCESFDNVNKEDVFETQSVSIQEFTFNLSTAEDDFNKDKKCLFATMIWSGAKILAEHIANEKTRSKLKCKSILEFGSAAGLPSMLCHRLGSTTVCASDYPSNSVITNLTRNIDRNTLTSQSDCKIGVVSHIWGESVTDLLNFNNGEQYDFVLAAECLWHHSSHSALIQSIKAVLSPDGTLFVTFSHHVPGCEAIDLGFFALAAQQGLRVIHNESFVAPHMWREQDATIFFYELLNEGERETECVK